ncbi:hypothetical protein L6164_009739 [Bauhinia variegata]|uniref:Uncharacterized protein n=1 Tax=Bauhinia variegata TaxID=167791 RepID=A0ACB9PKP3_BAUVA|nr:hypothetical protein L6164_009739 [Bauhinia variegata]
MKKIFLSSKRCFAFSPRFALVSICPIRRCFPFYDMEPNCSSSNTRQNHSPESSHDANKDKPTENDVSINHAEVAWHQMRREWVGDRSKNLQRLPRKPIMSLTTNYEDLVLSTVPFQQPIPLAEMVDLLVVIWHEEGLYD